MLSIFDGKNNKIKDLFKKKKTCLVYLWICVAAICSTCLGDTMESTKYTFQKTKIIPVHNFMGRIKKSPFN